MDENTRYVLDGSELGRAPMLGRCPCCDGVADYVRVSTAEGTRYRAVCSACGLATGLYVWPTGAGEAWNRRATNGARVITTQEIVEFRDGLTDGSGKTACWMETIEGVLRAICLEVSVSGDGREVYDWEYGEYWDREKVDAEGITWRLWDRRPTKADMDREPWGKVAYQVMSDAARQEAERIRQEIAERRRARERKEAEDRRRCCLYCAEHVPADTGDSDLGSAAPFVCALSGKIIENPSSRGCEHWHDDKREGCFA